MPLASLSKYIILFLFALVIVLGVTIGILSADNRALLKANAALKEQVAYRDIVINEVQNNIDALKAQAAAIEQSCAKRLKARNDVLNIFDISQREHPPQNHNASLNNNKKAIGADARLNGGGDNEFFKTISKTASDYAVDCINGYWGGLFADGASGNIWH